MDTPGYIILSRIDTHLRATQVLANNLANLDTPGFQAQRPVFGELLRPRSDGPQAPGDNAVAYSVDRGTWRNTAPGTLNSTGNPLDVALNGEGYFAVETPAGAERYTRAGRFALSADGRLVDPAGNAVLDTRGTPITLAPGDTRIEIKGDGTIRSENGPIAQLRVMRFDQPQSLKPEGNRLFVADAPGQPVERPAVVQGALEGGNVSGVLEMTRLTQEARDFDDAVGFADREGERLQTAVERILRKAG